jgi:DNA (cytosine-5)-methyltransferase 1
VSLKVGSLFSGIGGFDLGFERAGMTVKWQVEIDEFCNRVLAKHWPDVKRYRDIKAIGGEELEPVDVICGGFPCQPFSAAGKRRSKQDDRYLWPEMLRVISTVRPTWVIGENVAGIVSLALDDVLSDLENEGYSCQSFIIPACAVNAPHRRDRVWIVANRNDEWQLQQEGTQQEQRRRTGDGYKQNASDTDREHRKESEFRNQLGQARREKPSGWCLDESLWQETWIQAATRICRMDDGIPGRVDRAKRLKALGNAVVPQIVEIIGKAIMEIEGRVRDEKRG